MLWPLALWLLLLIPILIGLYIWVLRRRKRYAVRFSSLNLVRAALPRRSSLRRHLPFALFLIATGVKMIVFAGKDYDVANNPVLRFMKRHFNDVRGNFYEGGFLREIDGELDDLVTRRDDLARQLLSVGVAG